MKRFLKILLIVAGVIISLVLVLALTISPIAKNYIEKHSNELIGRKIIMKNLSANIFTGRLELDSVVMYEANGNQTFASIDTFSINMTLYKLLAKKVEITEIRVIKPFVQILQNGDKFNFDDLMKSDSTSTKDTTKSDFPKSIILKNIYMRGGNLVYNDQVLKNIIELKEMGVSIPEVRFEQGNTNAGIHLKIGDIATLDSKLKLNMKASTFELGLKCKNLAIDMIKPYLVPYFNIGKLDGLLDGDLVITGDMDHISQFIINGLVTGNGLNITNSYNDPLIGAKNIAIKMDNLDWSKSVYTFDFIRADGCNLSYIMNKDDSNVSRIFKPETGEKDSVANDSVSGTPMIFKTKDLHFENSVVSFVDNTLESPFRMDISKVNFQAVNFDMNGINEVKIQGTLPDRGLLNLQWNGSMDDMSNMNLLINVQNLGLKQFSPYCRHYTAYDITTGNMNFVTKTGIKQKNLKSSNRIDIYKMNVGNKQKNLKVEYNVPLKLAVYIMKDKDEKINIDIPVTGNTDNPSFSYKKIVIKTLVNLLVKVAVSPVQFLAGSLGMNQDKMTALEIDPIQDDFTAAQFTQLNELSTMLKTKPEMVLTMTQFVNLNNAVPAYSMYKVKERYLQSIDENKTDVVSSSEVNELDNSDAQFLKYINAHSTALNIPETASLQDKMKAIYPTDSVRQDLNRLFELRNKKLKTYLTETDQLPEKNIIIKTADNEAMEGYTDKSKYKIDMSLPGDEPAQDLKEIQ